jgi:hypothetical protein
VPTDFLALVSNALLDSYPSLESLASADQEDRHVSVSPAVVHLISTILQVMERLPVEFVWPVVRKRVPDDMHELTVAEKSGS